MEVLDWSSGLVTPRKLAETPQVTAEGKKYKRAMPGLRVRTLKSSATHKYHEGGPYHGAKLRKWTKDKYKRQVEVLTNVYTLPGISGRYEYSAEEDRYEWLTD